MLLRWVISPGLKYLLFVKIYAVTTVSSALKALEVLGLSDTRPSSIEVPIHISRVLSYQISVDT